MKGNDQLFIILLTLSYLFIFFLFFLYIYLLQYTYSNKKHENMKNILYFFRDLLILTQMFSYYLGMEVHFILIFCENPDKYFRKDFKCWGSQYFIYFILSMFYLILKFCLCEITVNFSFSKEDLNTSSISKFIISNHNKILLYTKTTSLFLFFFHKKYSIEGLICLGLLFCSVFLLFFTFLENYYQYKQCIKLTIHLILSVIYFFTCFLLNIGYLIRNTSFRGLIYILVVLIILNIVFFLTLPEKEIKIDLINISFETEFQVFNQLNLLTNSIEKIKHDRSSLLNLASYFRKREDNNYSCNDFIELLNNNELKCIVYKYIEKTYKSMINKYENSVLLKIGYALFLCKTLKKVDKAYIILYDLFHVNCEDLTLSQSYYTFIIIKYLQNLSTTNYDDKSNISIRYQGNMIINLISQISEIYYKFWVLLYNSKEHQDINLLRKLGSKIHTLTEEIDYRYNKFCQSKIKEKQIFLLYSYYKRDILNDFSNLEEEKIIELDDNSFQTINNFNINSLVSTSTFQFLIVSLKQDTFGTIVKISNEICIQLGYSSEELIGQSMNILIPDFIIKKHDELIKTKLKHLKILQSDENSLKEHYFFLKTKSKFMYPFAVFVTMVYDNDNKPFIFSKINFDRQQNLINELSSTCKILCDKNFIIQTFTSNSIHLVNLLNKAINNNNVEITKFIKEFNDEYFKLILSLNNVKSINKQKIKYSILKQYLNNKPEEIVTFNKIKCKISMSQLIINNEILGYFFDLMRVNNNNLNEVVKAKLSSKLIKSSSYKTKENDKIINPIKNSKTKKIRFESTPTEFKNINFNYIPEDKQFEFDFEKKEYYYLDDINQNKQKNNVNLLDYFKKEYLEKKLEIISDTSSDNSSLSYDSSYTNEDSNSNQSSSFSSMKEKNENEIKENLNIIINNKNSNDYYHVNLPKINYYIYSFQTNTFIDLPKIKKGKVEEIFYCEKILQKKLDKKEKIPLTKNETIEIENKLILPETKKNNNSFYLKNKSYFYDKIYSKDLSKSIVILIITEFLHLCIVIILGGIFANLCKSSLNILSNIIHSTEYLITLSDNSNNIFYYSFFLILLQNDKYNNLILTKEMTEEHIRNQMIDIYKQTSEVINSLTHQTMTKQTLKKIKDLNLSYYSISDKLDISSTNGDLLIVIKEINYAVYNFAHEDNSKINFLNLDYNFIFYNSNSAFLISINNCIEVFIEEYNLRLKTLKNNSWAFTFIFLVILFLCILVSFKGFLIMIHEKEKYLKYFFQIDQDYIKYNILKCKKYIQLNKLSTFDSKYFISNPKINYDIDDNSENNENDDENKLLKESNLINLNQKNIFQKGISKSYFISDKKNLKRILIIYILYIICLISILLIIMVKSSNLFNDISHLIIIYFSTMSHKSYILILFNYMRIYIIYFINISSNEELTYKLNLLNLLFSNIFGTHKEYKDKITNYIYKYGLSENSSRIFNEITEKSLCEFISNVTVEFISCDQLSNNISNYGLDSLMVYYIDSLLNIKKNFEINLTIALESGFTYNELFYGTEKYNDYLPKEPEKLELYNQLNPFNTINSNIMKDLSIINDHIFKPAFKYFLDSLSLDIENILEKIQSVETVLLIIFFLIIVIFNFIYYFPFLLKKNKEIKQIRSMLLIIPKNILYKLLIDEDDNEK